MIREVGRQVDRQEDTPVCTEREASTVIQDTYSYDRSFPRDFEAEHADLVVDLIDLLDGHGVEGLGRKEVSC